MAPYKFVFLGSKSIGMFKKKVTFTRMVTNCQFFGIVLVPTIMSLKPSASLYGGEGEGERHKKTP